MSGADLCKKAEQVSELGGDAIPQRGHRQQPLYRRGAAEARDRADGCAGRPGRPGNATFGTEFSLSEPFTKQIPNREADAAHTASSPHS